MGVLMKLAAPNQSLGMADSSMRDRAEHDRWLMERVREDDTDALEALLSRYWSRIALYAADIVGSVDDGRDIAQETFIRLWQTRARWVARGSVRSLLFGLAHNLAIDHLRKPAVRRRHTPRLDRIEDRTPATPADITEAHELDAALEAAIQALPPRRRETFVLIHTQGLSHREAAEVMGISPQTVANQMSSALTELRARLRRLLRDSR